MDSIKKKISRIFLPAIFLLVFFLGFVTVAWAQGYNVVESGGSGGGYELVGPDMAVRIPPKCLPDSYTVPGVVVNAGLINCMIESIDYASDDTMKSLKALGKKQAREEAWDQIKENAKKVLAQEFRNSLSSLSRQIAHDTAVWVASGGKGQQPLFITEGWGAYLKNAADSALGEFIDGIGQQYGVSLCEPGNINIRIAIETGINYQQKRKVSCTFSKMMQNWESAISDANFSFEYTNSMRPGENDVSVFLQLQSQAFQTVATEVSTKEKEANTNSLFQDVKDFAGKILTPGTAVKDAFLNAVNPLGKNASFGYETFTGTIADIIEEFLNTLVSQLLTNLQKGLFSSGGGNESQPFQLPDLSALFNPNASPRTFEGTTGAEERFNNLIPLNTRIGGPYDILTKLMLCPEQSKNNLGPTDCVLDPVLSEAIRQKTQVKDLPQEVKNRPFAPPINEVTNPQVAFTERNIKIMRKYRIVPVGWEIVAEKIRQANQKKTYTLQDVMQSEEFKEYIDPYWVLEVPELFCRQLGYGAHNIYANSQDNSISRDEYCADEQQCIQKNDSGNCTAYGYCTEERRYWDFGKTCEPKYNTCETFSGRDGLKDSWLVNSLDFRYCNESNYGCRWLSALYNTTNNNWTHLDPETVISQCATTAGCAKTVVATSPVVKEGHIRSEDGALIMSQPCSDSACSSENMVPNGDGEDDIPDNNWVALQDLLADLPRPLTSAELNLVTTTGATGGTTPRSGQKMIAIRTDNEVNGFRIVYHKYLTLKAGKTYLLTGWAYSATGGSPDIYMDFGISGSIADVLVCGAATCGDNTNRYVTSTGGWQQLRRIVTLAGADHELRPRMLVSSNNAGWVYFDDIQLQEVGTGRCTYNSESRTCTFYQGGCTIPYGGTMCAVTNCQVGNNLLTNFNSGFETADGAATFRAAKWNFTDSYYDLENRLYRDQKEGASGYNLVGKSNGSTIPLSVKLDNIPVTPGKRYALKFKLRSDFINQGGLSVGMYEKDTDASINGLSIARAPAFWQDYSFEFDAADTVSSTYLKINITAYSQLLVYLDDVELKEVDKNCNANSVWLINGTQEVTDKDMYFDAQVYACDASSEGCSQFIRTKPGLGSNLIPNGSFNSATSGWEFLASPGQSLSNFFVSISAGSNNYAKVFQNNLGYSRFKAIDILPGTYYIISFDAAQTTAAADNTAKFEMFLTDDRTTSDTDDGIRASSTDCDQTGDNTLTLFNNPADTAFEKKSCKFLAPAGAYVLRYKIFGNATITVDNIQLEAVNYTSESPSAYTDYNPNTRPASQLTYLKKASDFFNCYRDAIGNWADRSSLWSILAGQHPACKDYAAVCTSDEVGCELYRPVNGDPAVPGIVDALDVCPAECVGYSVYRQEETNFVSPKYRQFIADNKLKYCTAAYAGCDEFTNLDKLNQGGEAREYYVSFRACQKPGAPDEADYYAWEGSDVTGYQLKVYKLKKSDADSSPCTFITYTGVNSSDCHNNDLRNQGTCSRDQMFSNPDCREFYNTLDGSVSYKLVSKTISVSDNCHPYRRTQTQTGAGEAQSDCSAKQGWWDNSSCIYMAIPQEGRTCPAALVGCREFTGNRANNVRNLIYSDFGTDSVSTSSWQGGNAANPAAGIMISTESSFVGGYSISNSGGQVIRHPVTIQKGKAYTLSFWAKADPTAGSFTFSTPGNSIRFTSTDTPDTVFSLAATAGGELANTAPLVTTDWKKFDLGPVFVSWDPNTGSDEYLEFHIPSNKKVYLDNIILKEVREDVFAIDNSWFTPVACDNKLGDPDGSQAIADGSCAAAPSTFRGTRCSVGEMLGCAAYRDRADQLNYFRSFAKLCRQEAAGCEALIDTYNYSPAESKVFNAGDKSEITVPADETVYLVNDRQYACQASEKGCTAYGLPIISKYEEVAGYNTVFLRNDPDSYNAILCKFNEVWCDQYIGPTSVRYFKNPHGRVCLYEIKEGQLEGKWYVAGTDELCTTTLDQTLGKGYGSLTDKLQPVGVFNNVTGDGPDVTGYDRWVGLCPASQSGCGEYIDPLVTIYSPVKIESGAATVKLNTLYAVRDKNGGAIVSATTSDPRYSGNPPHARIVYPDYSSSTVNKIKRFYISCPPEKYDDCRTNDSIVVSITGGSHPVLVRAGVYYTFAAALDRSSCQGLADYDTGCILLNERNAMDYASSTSWKDRVSQYLKYDAYATYVQNRHIVYDLAGNELAGNIERTAPLSGQNDSNIIVKAKPDRTCNTWLTCTTYEKAAGTAAGSSEFFSLNDRCLTLGLCDSFNEQGICNHFVSNSMTSSYDRLRDINKTGYAYFGQGNNAYYSYELMPQPGEAANVTNGNFEYGFSSGESTLRQIGGLSGATPIVAPLGWRAAFYNCLGTNCYPKEKTYGLTHTEIMLLTGQKTAHEGVSALQIWGGNAAMSELIEVENDTEYYLSGWVNTANLQGAGNTSTPPDPSRAEIQLKFFDASGNVTTSVTVVQNLGPGNLGHSEPEPDNINGGWFFVWGSNSPLRVERGTPWKQVTFHFKTGPQVYRMQIALMNMNPRVGGGYDNISNFGGYTLWDDIQLKPLLKAGDTQLINRTCRVYPEQDSVSCKYTSGNNSFYGLYGYCVLQDPANPDQCLQWWPVDSIKGEIMDDFSPYYQERVPLYYCVSKSTRKFNFLSASIAMEAGGKLPDEFQGLVKSSEDMVVTEFSIPPTSRPLFRYPFIYKIPVTMAAVGVGLDKGIYGTAFWGDMYPKRFCPLSLGGFVSNFLLGGRELCFSASKVYENEEVEADQYCGDTGGNCVDKEITSPPCLGADCDNWSEPLCESSSTPPTCRWCRCAQVADCSGWFCQIIGTVEGWLEDAISFVMDLLGLIFSWIADMFSKLLEAFQLLPEDEWGGFGIIPISVGGGGFGFAIPIPVPWHVAMSVKAGISGMLGGLGEFMDSGIGGGIIGVRIITDADSSSGVADPVPSMAGDILGYVSFSEASGVYGAGAPIIMGSEYNLEYCDQVVQVVNSSGQNKAWATRLSLFSQYESPDSDCVRDEAQDIGSHRGEAGRCFYASNYCVMKDCILNPEAICDFCGNFVGVKADSGLASTTIVDLTGKALNDSICTELSGGFYQGNQEGTDVEKGKIYKLMRGSSPATAKECKDLYYFKYSTGILGILFNIGMMRYDLNQNGFIYQRIFAENKFDYNADFRPYGSLVAPSLGQYPTDWDSRPEVTGNQPLFYELPNTGLSSPYQARSGQQQYAFNNFSNRKINLERLFAQSYGAWRWSNEVGRYLPVSGSDGLNWNLPDFCYPNDGRRPLPRYETDMRDFCRVHSVITNTKMTLLNDTSVSLDTPLMVKLSFNIFTDPDQVPLRSLLIDWGDGLSPTTYSGISLLPRPASSSAFVLYHYYDRRHLQGNTVTTTIKVKDNWNSIGGLVASFNVSDLESGIDKPLDFYCDCLATRAYCGDPFCRSLVGSTTDFTLPYEVNPDEVPFEDGGTLKGGEYFSLRFTSTTASGNAYFYLCLATSSDHWLRLRSSFSQTDCLFYAGYNDETNRAGAPIFFGSLDYIEAGTKMALGVNMCKEWWIFEGKWVSIDCGILPIYASTFRLINTSIGAGKTIYRGDDASVYPDSATPENDQWSVDYASDPYLQYQSFNEGDAIRADSNPHSIYKKLRICDRNGNCSRTRP